MEPRRVDLRVVRWHRSAACDGSCGSTCRDARTSAGTASSSRRLVSSAGRGTSADHTCAEYGRTGTLGCAACLLDPSTCRYICGNGTAEPGEDCDGSDLRGLSCETFGMVGTAFLRWGQARRLPAPSPGARCRPSARSRPTASSWTATSTVRTCAIDRHPAKEITSQVTVCGNGIPQGDPTCSAGSAATQGTANILVPDETINIVDVFMTPYRVDVTGDANGDGLPQPGETVQLFITLINAGPARPDPPSRHLDGARDRPRPGRHARPGDDRPGRGGLRRLSRRGRLGDRLRRPPRPAPYVQEPHAVPGDLPGRPSHRRQPSVRGESRRRDRASESNPGRAVHGQRWGGTPGKAERPGGQTTFGLMPTITLGVGGFCDSAQQAACDDGNPCTTDSCIESVGCVHVYNTAPCDDGNSCTVGDTCSNGQCLPGPGAGLLPFADPFTTPALDSCWTWVDPLGDSTYAPARRPARQDHDPAGRSHDCWNTRANCTRIVRDIPRTSMRSTRPRSTARTSRSRTRTTGSLLPGLWITSGSSSGPGCRASVPGSTASRTASGRARFARPFADRPRRRATTCGSARRGPPRSSSTGSTTNRGLKWERRS